MQRWTTATQLLAQIDMFRKRGMGNYRDLLVHLAKDPAMIFWLDNNENHKGAPNENWGRELAGTILHGAGATTASRTLRNAPAPSPAGPSPPRFPGFPTVGIRGALSIFPKTTTTGRRHSWGIGAGSTARTL